MPCMRGGGERIPNIVEIPRNTVLEGGDYDQQVATYQLGSSAQENTECQKCHSTEKYRYPLMQY